MNRDVPPPLTTAETLFAAGFAWFAIGCLTQLSKVERLASMDRLFDVSNWIWGFIAAAMIGFWGYLVLLLSLAFKSNLTRKLFIWLGGVYLGIAALMAWGMFNNEGDASIIFYCFAVPIGSTIIMGPILLLFVWIGNEPGR